MNFGLKKFIQRKRARNFQNRALQDSNLFDNTYYRLQAINSNIFVSHRDAIQHYIDDGDRLRISTHVLFDVFHYHNQYRDLDGSGMSALFHFILHGYKEFRNPHPLFDMRYVAQQIKDKNRNPLKEYLTAPPGTYNPHPEVDEHYIIEQLKDANISFNNALCTFLTTENVIINPSRDFDMHAYSAQNPDIRPYNAAYHYAIAGKKEKRITYKASSSVNGLELQIDSAAHMDIDIIPPHTNILTLDRSLSIDGARDAASLLRALKNSTKYKEVSKIFFIPHLEIGGAEKVLANIVKAILNIEKNEKILIVSTDNESETAINWMPHSDRLFFCNISTYVSHIEEVQFLCIIGIYVQLSRCRDIYIINSRVGWNFIEKYGRAVSSIIKCHAFVFCYDYDEYGRRAGYAWTHLLHCIENVDKIFTDNKITPKILTKDLRLEKENAEKFIILYQPIDVVGNFMGVNSTFNREDRKYKKKSILWASRFHRQKNIRLALKIASLMPEYDFIIAGGFADDSHINGLRFTENVNFIGPYNGFNFLFIENVSLFLYTSDWDGLPNVLLEIGSVGIPIVARNVGGVGDLIDDTTGWLIDSEIEALAFSGCIKKILSDPAEMQRRSANMKLRIENQHGWQSFHSKVADHFVSVSEGL